jgi:hypothetical protein
MLGFLIGSAGFYGIKQTQSPCCGTFLLVEGPYTNHDVGTVTDFGEN